MAPVYFTQCREPNGCLSYEMRRAVWTVRAMNAGCWRLVGAPRSFLPSCRALLRAVGVAPVPFDVHGATELVRKRLRGNASCFHRAVFRVQPAPGAVHAAFPGVSHCVTLSMCHPGE